MRFPGTGLRGADNAISNLERFGDLTGTEDTVGKVERLLMTTRKNRDKFIMIFIVEPEKNKVVSQVRLG